jgi:hypothetical protein
LRERFDAIGNIQIGWNSVQGRRIGAHDMLIAAHARALGAVCVTDNVAAFNRVPTLEVEPGCGSAGPTSRGRSLLPELPVMILESIEAW